MYLRSLYEVSCTQVLKKEFPKGVDIVYESVGGKMFDLCLNALAIYGRLVVIGMISQVGGSIYMYLRFHVLFVALFIHFRIKLLSMPCNLCCN